MKSVLILIIGVLAGALLVIGGYFYLTSSEVGDETVTVTFTEEEIQEKIGKDFPKEDRILNYIPIVIEEPVVKFLGDTKRVQISAKATIDIPFVGSEEVSGVFTGSIRYEKEDGTLRTSDLTVESLSTSSLPKKFESAVRAALTVSARKYLEDHIIHTLEKEDYKGKMAEMLLQKIKVKDGRLEIILGL